MTWKRNPGKCPEEAKGKRVRVRLAGTGEEPKYGDEVGWPANTTRWTVTGHPYDVKDFEVI
jgi:hypothetical protein